MIEYITNSSEETFLLGQKVGKTLPSNAIVCFFGDLGAGKTLFIKGLAAAASGCASDEVNSPTFVYLNIYEGIKNVFHFDLYRLKNAEEFIGMGFDEYFSCGGICAIEWSERIASCIPPGSIRIEISLLGESCRKILINGWKA